MSIASLKTMQRFTSASAPKEIYWEVTRSCPLACAYCPSRSTAEQHPRELTTEEALALIDHLANFGSPPPRLIFTGGNPLCRPDLFDLIRRTKAHGFPLAVELSALPELSVDRLKELAVAGVESVTLNLNGSDAETHDRVSAIPGSYDRTRMLAQSVLQSGLKLEINTLVADQTLTQIPAIFEQVRGWQASVWNLYFYIPVNGNQGLQALSPMQKEVLLWWIAETEQTVPFKIRGHLSPSLNRVRIEKRLRDGQRLDDILQDETISEDFGLRPGNGLLFITHVGDIQPGPFVPVTEGNVRTRSVIRAYQRSRLFRDLRKPDQFGGKCRHCPFNKVCGGSRAFAFHTKGDWLGVDPSCPYQPQRVAAS